MQAPTFDEFNTMLSIVSDSNSSDLKTCIRLPYYDVFIYNQAPSTIFDEMQSRQDCANTIPIHSDPYSDWTNVIRIVNGRVLFGETRRNEDGSSSIYQRKYFPHLLKRICEKYEPKPIGMLSRDGMFNMVQISQPIVDSNELHSLLDVFDIAKINMSFVYNECGFEDDCIVITQDILDAGLTHYYPCYYEDVKHMIRDEILVKKLQVGDAIIVRKQGNCITWHAMFIKEEFDTLYKLKQDY